MELINLDARREQVQSSSEENQMKKTVKRNGQSLNAAGGKKKGPEAIPTVQFTTPRKAKDKKAGKAKIDPGKLAVPVQHRMKSAQKIETDGMEEEYGEEYDVEGLEYSTDDYLDIIVKSKEKVEEDKINAPVRQDFADDLVENLTKQKLNMQLKGVSDRMFQVQRGI